VSAYCCPVTLVLNILLLVPNDIILFSRDAEENHGVNLFSVALPNQLSVKARAIVSHEGQDSGEGIWICSKDKNQCLHIARARLHLKDLMKDGDKEICHDEEMASTGKVTAQHSNI